MEEVRPALGSREYLLGRAECLAETIRAVSDRLEDWGARRVMPGIFEDARNLSRPEQAIRFVERETGRSLALRQDMTRQIRRIVDRELAHLPTPYKLFYIERVWVDDQGLSGRPKERLQAGGEWIGPGPAAEPALLNLALDLLADLGLETPTLTLGDARLRDAWRAAWQPVDGEAAETALDRKDVSAWRESGDGRWPDLAWALLDGNEAVPADWPLPVRTLVEGLQALGRSVSDRVRVRIDPVARAGAGYYTGMWFKFSSGLPHDPWLRGGRYDARYSRPGDAVGFTLDLDPPVDAMARGLIPPLRRPRWLWLGPMPAPRLASARLIVPEPEVADPEAWARSHGLDGLARPTADGGLAVFSLEDGRELQTLFPETP